jgi:hypothetical protein
MLRELRYNPEALGVALEASYARRDLVKLSLGDVAERRMPQVVRNTRALNNVRIQAACLNCLVRTENK